MSERHAYSVAMVNPFWRYAVALEERPDLPAVPFFGKSAALVFYDKNRESFPERTTVLLKRRFAGHVDVVLYDQRSTAKDG